MLSVSCRALGTGRVLGSGRVLEIGRVLGTGPLLPLPFQVVCKSPASADLQFAEKSCWCWAVWFQGVMKCYARTSCCFTQLACWVM